MLFIYEGELVCCTFCWQRHVHRFLHDYLVSSKYILYASILLLTGLDPSMSFLRICMYYVTWATVRQRHSHTDSIRH
jgi:hypothetical protein